MSNTTINVESIVEDIWYDFCIYGLGIENLLDKYAKEYQLSEDDKKNILTILLERQKEYDAEIEESTD